MKKYFIYLPLIFLFPGCVANRVLRQSQLETSNLRSDSVQLANQIIKLQDDMAALNKRIGNLSNQNSQLGEQTATQQSQLTETEKTLQQQQQSLKQQQQKLQQLQTLLAQQKNQSDQLKNKMSEALKGFNSNDLSVVQKNGKVYVSLSENLLFPSGSAVVNPKGVDALSKLAAVLNLNADVAVNIEGHTDSIPIRGRFKDNWDLSTGRANSIVRILVDNYKVDPVRVVASGHSFFDPLDTNATLEGRAKNRRTEIILSPKLEEMYKLLEI
ncbi:MAG: OmpA family protein [Ferruginibacter sp.]|nr:OmpA family protein [Ferruginibacter sp.]